MSTQDKQTLSGPFVVLESDKSEMLLFEALNDIEQDRYNVLWENDYLGYDVEGRYFLLKKVSLKEGGSSVY